MNTTFNSVQSIFSFLLTLLGMGMIVSCMPDDGQHRERNILTRSTLEGTSRKSRMIPVFSAQTMPTSTRDNPLRRRAYVVQEVDFQQHAEIRIDLPQASDGQTTHQEVILIDSLGTHYPLPGLGRGGASTYRFSKTHDGLLELELVNGQGEHYPEVVINVVIKGSQPRRKPDSQLTTQKSITG